MDRLVNGFCPDSGIAGVSAAKTKPRQENVNNKTNEIIIGFLNNKILIFLDIMILINDVY